MKCWLCGEYVDEGLSIRGAHDSCAWKILEWIQEHVEAGDIYAYELDDLLRVWAGGPR